MIAMADRLNAHFQELDDALAGVDLAGLEEAAWQLLFEIERQEKGLGVVPDAGPDFTNCTSAHELADAAQRRIDLMDSRLNRAQQAHKVIGKLLTAFEQARDSGQQAEQLVREIDRLILTLERDTP